MRPSHAFLNRFARPLLNALGVLCVALGLVGAFVPLLPSTVFFIVAAWCFARSSPAAHCWLERHPLIGPPLRDWQAGRGLSVRAKTLAVASILLTFSFSIGVVVEGTLVRAALGLFAVSLSLYLLWQPTRP